MEQKDKFLSCDRFQTEMKNVAVSCVFKQAPRQQATWEADYQCGECFCLAGHDKCEQDDRGPDTDENRERGQGCKFEPVIPEQTNPRCVWSGSTEHHKDFHLFTPLFAVLPVERTINGIFLPFDLSYVNYRILLVLVIMRSVGYDITNFHRILQYSRLMDARRERDTRQATP